MEFELEGKLTDLLPTQVISDKFKKRDLFVEIPNGMYSEHIKLEAVNDMADKLSGAKIGSRIHLKCNLRGRYSKRKDGSEGHMNSIQVRDAILTKEGSIDNLIQELESPW